MIVLLALILAFMIYLIIARSKNLWPFQQKVVDELGDPVDPDGNTNTQTPWWMIVLFIFVGLLILAGLAAGIYMTVLRYKLIGKALKSGHTGTAAMLAAPELGQGVADVIHAV